MPPKEEDYLLRKSSLLFQNARTKVDKKDENARKCTFFEKK